jgi:histidine decarboxylase
MALYHHTWTPQGIKSLNDEVKSDAAYFEDKSRHHGGYPYNLTFREFAHALAPLHNTFVNQLGDPGQGGQYAMNAFSKELETVRICKGIFGGKDFEEDLWGYVSSSGTENNVWAIHIAVTVLMRRNSGREPVIICSEEAHYSFDKGAAITRVKLVKVPCHDNGSIKVDEFKEAVEAHSEVPIILGLMSGTTVKEAKDDIAACLGVMKGRERAEWYAMVDGALSAPFLPYVGAPKNIVPGFWHDIDSVSFSGHKFLGSPDPCGVLITWRKHIDVIGKAVEYIKSNDTTLGGSRSGFAAYGLWHRLGGRSRFGHHQFRKPCEEDHIPSEIAAECRHQ